MLVSVTASDMNPQGPLSRSSFFVAVDCFVFLGEDSVSPPQCSMFRFPVFDAIGHRTRVLVLVLPMHLTSLCVLPQGVTSIRISLRDMRGVEIP